MKKQILLSLFVVNSTLATYAQTKPDLHKLTDAEKMQTLAMKSTSVHAGSIAYAKSIGKTPREYGQAMGKIFSPSWKQTGNAGKDLHRVLEHMNSIAQAFGTSFELTDWAEKEATIKRGMLLQDPRIAAMFMNMGVTAQDMEDWDEGVMSEIANSLGLSMAQRKDGQNMVVTVKTL